MDLVSFSEVILLREGTVARGTDFLLEVDETDILAFMLSLSKVEDLRDSTLTICSSSLAFSY